MFLHVSVCPQGGVRGGGGAWQGGACGRGTHALPPCGYYEIRSMSGRYASHWNAFLLFIYLVSSLQITVFIDRNLLSNSHFDLLVIMDRCPFSHVQSIDKRQRNNGLALVHVLEVSAGRYFSITGSAKMYVYRYSASRHDSGDGSSVPSQLVLFSVGNGWF